MQRKFWKWERKVCPATPESWLIGRGCCSQRDETRWSCATEEEEEEETPTKKSTERTSGTMSSSPSRSDLRPSGLKRFCLWLHHAPPTSSSPLLPLTYTAPPPPAVSRYRLLLAALLLCSLLLMLLLLLWNYNCLFISRICSPPGEEAGEEGGGGS
ncbi:hypothetical protein D9C73_028032 [Collichthys lucidus]|uniref:Uncharacterized protein n=1 Tax=Collichthys lucidus TaxID=240159 RepID=A0A4U5TW81_COLLU|nr:hypothetical protein D9C73_028032 [Collichthys lucidus]